MSAEATDRLVRHARTRHEQTLQRARTALGGMADAGDAITISGLADRAGVSRSWIYTQPELREQIEQLRQSAAKASASPRETAIHASVESLRRRLDLAHQRITELRTENQELRRSLASVHGQLRVATEYAPLGNEREGVDDNA
ncbi:MAG TPA: DUF6262 family protein [Mycobacterium sp.]